MQAGQIKGGGMLFSVASLSENPISKAQLYISISGSRLGADFQSIVLETLRKYYNKQMKKTRIKLSETKLSPHSFQSVAAIHPTHFNGN